MDSRVVQSQVNEKDEQVVSPGSEEHNTEHDSKSTVFMNKVKARARKIRNTIKNIGHPTSHDADADLVEDKEIVEDHEEDAPTTPIYDTEAVNTATPTSVKDKNLAVTKDTRDGEDRHDHDHDPLVGSLSSTTEVNQNIATEKPTVLEKDLQEQGSRPEAYNSVPNYQNEVTDPSGLAYDSEDVKSSALVSKKVKDLKNSEIDFEGTTVKRDEPHHDSLVEGHSSTTEINQNLATEKPVVLEKDLHEQASRPEAYNPSNHQTEVTDPSGLVYDNEVKSTTASEKVKNSEKSEFDFEGTKNTRDKEIEKPLVLEKDLQEQGIGPEAYNISNYQTEVTDPSRLGNSGKSEFDFEGTKKYTRDKEDRHDHAPLVEDLSSTTEINQNIDTEKPILLEKDTHEQGTRPEAYNLSNYQTEVTDPSGLAYDSEAVKNVPRTSENVEDLRKSEIDFEGATIKGDEPHHDPLVEDFSSSTEINQNTATEKPIVFENDPHQQGSILESYDLPYHQTKVTDQSGKGSDEINDSTKVEDSFEPKPIIEPKTLPTFAETEYSLAGRNDLFDQQTKTQYESEKEETFNNVTNTAEKQPSYESVETQPKHTDETEALSAATASETFSPKNNEAYEEKDNRNEDEKVKETHEDYEKVMLELKEEVPETITGNDVVTETKNEDKDDTTASETFSPQNNEASKLAHDDYEKVMLELKEEVPETSTGDGVGTETKNVDKDHAKEVPVKDYLAEKLRPGEEDKALSEVITEALHKKSEKVSEEANVESPGKGYVDRFKGAVGSWFYTSEEKQSPQVAGDGDLSKSKDSFVEGERVSQVKNE